MAPLRALAAVVLLLALLVEDSSSNADSSVGTIDQACTATSEEASGSKCEIPGAFKEEELSLLTLNTHVHRRAHHRPRSYSELSERQFYWRSGGYAAWSFVGGVVAVPLSLLLAIVFMLAALGACCLYCLATSHKDHTGNPGSAEALLRGAPAYGATTATDKALPLNVLAFKDAQHNIRITKVEDSSDEGSTCPRPEVEEETEPEAEFAEGEIPDSRAEAEWALQIALYDNLAKPEKGRNQKQVLSEATLKALAS